MQQPGIFSYSDYRSYLKDMISYRKQHKARCNQRQTALDLGFSSHSALSMILQGKRSLQGQYLERCCKLFGLNLSEKLYLEAMVQAKALSAHKRSRLLREVKLLAERWDPPSHELGFRLLDFFYVQQILCLLHRWVTSTAVQKLFRYPIPLKDVHRILEWMVEKDFVARMDGRYRIKRSVILSTDEVPNEVCRQMHLDAAQVARQALLRDSVDKREFQTYLMTIDGQRLPEMKARIKKMVFKIISEFETELDASSIVQLHFNLFELVDEEKLKAWRENEIS